MSLRSNPFYAGYKQEHYQFTPGEPHTCECQMEFLMKMSNTQSQMCKFLKISEKGKEFFKLFGKVSTYKVTFALFEINSNQWACKKFYQLNVCTDIPKNIFPRK